MESRKPEQLTLQTASRKPHCRVSCGVCRCLCNRQMDGWTDRQDRWMDGQMDIWVDEWMDALIGRRTDEWIDG